jgi:Cdc6-like AAA superfamily ATPase
MPREPRSPQTFFGRDSELAHIIHIIFTHIGSRPARIAILGPGGYGKTTLANAVLTHYHIQEHFRDARYFVACESLFSPGALLVEIAKSLGLFDGATDVSWPRIRTALNTKDCIICFDNFESLWDQDADIRNSVEELLSRVAELQHVSLLITMRGTVRPAQTQWTMPLLPPLTTLEYNAAKRVWEHTTDNYDVFAEELIKAVDYVPLAVSLLAHLAQATSPQLLLKEWHEKHIGFIYTNQANKQSNLEYSIQVSLNSGRMRANPCAKELLGILSMLPDGIHMQQVERFKKLFEGINVLSSLRTLQECSLISVIGERY